MRPSYSFKFIILLFSFFLCCQITKKKAYALFSLVMRKLLKEMRNKTFLISVLILLDKWRETHFFDRHTLQETNSFFRISCKNVSKKACTHKTPIRLWKAVDLYIFSINCFFIFEKWRALVGFLRKRRKIKLYNRSNWCMDAANFDGELAKVILGEKQIVYQEKWKAISYEINNQIMIVDVMR